MAVNPYLPAFTIDDRGNRFSLVNTASFSPFKDGRWYKIVDRKTGREAMVRIEQDIRQLKQLYWVRFPPSWIMEDAEAAILLACGDSENTPIGWLYNDPQTNRTTPTIPLWWTCQNNGWSQGSLRRRAEVVSQRFAFYKVEGGPAEEVKSPTQKPLPELSFSDSPTRFINL